MSKEHYQAILSALELRYTLATDSAEARVWLDSIHAIRDLAAMRRMYV